LRRDVKARSGHTSICTDAAGSAVPARRRSVGPTLGFPIDRNSSRVPPAGA
jgi:hypothetical protein